MTSPQASHNVDTAEAKPLRRSHIFNYLAITGFSINMLVVAVIVYYWFSS